LTAVSFTYDNKCVFVRFALSFPKNRFKVYFK
jgi:hypothetical protein